MQDKIGQLQLELHCLISMETNFHSNSYFFTRGVKGFGEVIYKYAKPFIFSFRFLDGTLTDST